MEKPEKRYIGDSVYVDFDGYHYVLTTENGLGPSNTIALEPEVFHALVDYTKYVKQHYEQEVHTNG